MQYPAVDYKLSCCSIQTRLDFYGSHKKSMMVESLKHDSNADTGNGAIFFNWAEIIRPLHEQFQVNLPGPVSYISKSSSVCAAV